MEVTWDAEKSVGWPNITGQTSSYVDYTNGRHETKKSSHKVGNLTFYICHKQKLCGLCHVLRTCWKDEWRILSNANLASAEAGMQVNSPLDYYRTSWWAVPFNLQHISRSVLGRFIGSLLAAEMTLKSFRIGQMVLLFQLLLSLPGGFMSAACCLYELVKPSLSLKEIPTMAFATDHEIHRHTDSAGVQGSTGCTCVSANQTLDNN